MTDPALMNSMDDLVCARDERDQLRKLIELQGFKVIDGDFTMRDGRHSSFILRPVDPLKLIKLAVRAMEDP